LRKLGIFFAFATLFACGVLHICTFIGPVPRLSILVPFLPLIGAVLCARQVLPWRIQLRSRAVPRGKIAMIGWVLLAYALILFVYFYKTTGGSTSVSIVNGQYYSMSQGHMLRPITHEQYEMFPTQWFRVMSAWMGMMAAFCLSSLLNADSGLRAR
jgi:ABC-type proline/glycine betaine transport system permease subunit